MSKVVSTKQQLEKLVSLMNENPFMAKGICTKVQSAKKWEEFTRELNCLGPPVRTTAKWIKIWADMKSKTKKRVAHNKAEFRATGGGRNRLQTYTSLEEAIIGLLELESCVNPPGDEFGLNGGVNANCEVLVETLPPNEATEMAESAETHEVETRPESSRRKYNKTNRLKLLEEQTNAQKKFYEAMTATMEQLKKSAKETEKYARRTYYLKQETDKELLRLKKEKLQLLKNQLGK